MSDITVEQTEPDKTGWFKLVAWDGAEQVGRLVLRVQQPSNPEHKPEVQLRHIRTKASRQGEGIGMKLINEARKLATHVRHSTPNEMSAAMWEKYKTAFPDENTEYG